MKILVLGGTGAMGKPLVSELSQSNMTVYVTSRSNHEDIGNIHYIRGNAHELSFLKKVLNMKFEVVIDFMFYQLSEFKERVGLFLDSTNQYIFLSSSRVYADSIDSLDETKPRLLDISKDKKFLSTNEYSLIKAREENFLLDSDKFNWTIIRPYITYESNRLQLGIYEKELWLSRIIQNKTLVIPKSILNHRTTLTSGKDVSSRIAKIAGNKKSLGEIINISTSQSATWQQIIDIYFDEIFKLTGKSPKVIYSDRSDEIAKIMHAEYQLKYDRLFERTFDNTKVERISNVCDSYIDLSNGLRDSLKAFMGGNRRFNSGSWIMKAYMDRVAKEKTPLKSINTLSGKLKYSISRYTPYFFLRYGIK